MKVELIEEIKLDENPWYIIEIDGKYVKGTYDKSKAEEFYAKVLEDINFLNKKRNILKSEEIEVNLKF